MGKLKGDYRKDIKLRPSSWPPASQAGSTWGELSANEKGQGETKEPPHQKNP